MYLAANSLWLNPLYSDTISLSRASVYFPTEKMIYKEARDREIISQYNGFNHKELAAKYNMSESYIRAIINRHKKSA